LESHADFVPLLETKIQNNDSVFLRMPEVRQARKTCLQLFDVQQKSEVPNWPSLGVSGWSFRRRYRLKSIQIIHFHARWGGSFLWGRFFPMGEVLGAEALA